MADIKFEYDPGKSRINKQKHGVDFEKVKTLWGSPNLQFKTTFAPEDRYGVIGLINSKLYICFFTCRKNTIRIISCRRAREKESELYYEHYEEKV
ncbi:MAG: BrnT family toxin [Candidatus Margulisbacteria bacterium]|nr:BrnT family toxin [Candidatus Margulisiibacteriota bacterium]